VRREEARALLGVGPAATAEDIERAFRARVRTAHPDRGGDAELFRRLVTARTTLARAAEGPRPRLTVRYSPARRLIRAVQQRLPWATKRRVH
jgi:hypothetical protein